jgi:putative flavoprotein involved in K+ transport
VRATVVIVGAGHSGLAMSRRLTERGIDHVVLERGGVGNSWRTERWDSLRLLTPNWQSGLPAFAYRGDDPDGYMGAHEVADHLAAYAHAVEAPVRTGVTVTGVAPADDGYRVETDDGDWDAAAVVLANGGSGLANIPAIAAGLPDGVHSLSSKEYRSPDLLHDGGVLVVGASASGVQLADELARSGRDVTVSAGEHVRMPRSYRGRDIFWWMDAAGVLDERFDEIDDIVRARHVPSPQLVGSAEHRTVDLASLRERGVRVVGRLGRIQDGLAQFSGGLANTVRLADLKLDRLLERFDAWAVEAGPDGAGSERLGEPERPARTEVDAAPALDLHLAREGVGTVLWATGYRPDYSWLNVPVLDYKGRLPHEGGVIPKSPGLYVLGTSLLRRRRSTYIGGAAQDSEELADHLEGFLAGQGSRLASEKAL